MATPRALLERIVIGLALGVALVYTGDFLYVRIRMLHPKSTDPFETLTAPRILAIPEKGSKTSYEVDEQNPTQTLVCVHALFPHYGDQPCWYLKKRIDNPIPMFILGLEHFQQSRPQKWVCIRRTLRTLSSPR
jgi:hypothetical protein